MTRKYYRTVHFRVDKDSDEKLRNLCKENSMNTSELLRVLLLEGDVDADI